MTGPPVQPQEVTDTNNGFLVGTDPKEPPRTAEQWVAVQQEQMGNQPLASAGTPEPAQSNGSGSPRTYTEEDLERVRREEKDKLYGRIESMDAELKTIRAEREAAEAARLAEIEAEAERQRQAEEDEMDAKSLIARRDEEWKARLAEIEDRHEQDRAVFERERRFQELETYRQNRVAQEAEFIIPELRDLVKGNSETEIDEAIEEMKARTAAIMGQFEATAGMQRQNLRGAAPTAPPVGPMEQMESYESLTADDIRSMDMETYKKFRQGLLNASSRAYRG